MNFWTNKLLWTFWFFFDRWKCVDDLKCLRIFGFSKCTQGYIMICCGCQVQWYWRSSKVLNILSGDWTISKIVWNRFIWLKFKRVFDSNPLNLSPFELHHIHKRTNPPHFIWTFSHKFNLPTSYFNIAQSKIAKTIH